MKNFETFQHYKDRSPPWIKLYNSTLDDYLFSKLPDASKSHLIAIWLLASRYNNQIPADPSWIKDKIGATENVDLKILEKAGFIIFDQGCSETLADCKQSAMPEKRESREEKIYVRFDEFWKNYPSKRKVDRKNCLKKWKEKNLESMADLILKDIAVKKQTESWREGFSPAPLTYINQERWQDGVETEPERGLVL